MAKLATISMGNPSIPPSQSRVNSSPIAGRDRDLIILELFEDNEAMKKIIKDLLFVVKDTHPEIILKYTGFIEDNTK